MIKKIIYLPIFLILFLLLSNNIYADETNYVDMSEWKFIQLTSNSEHTISKFYSVKDSQKFAFCLQPNEYFNKKLNYTKTICDDVYIFNIVKAYKEYGLPLEETETDIYNKYNYYIASQILIWEYVEPGDYIFNKDYSTYKQEILDYINSQSSIDEQSLNDTIYESKVNEINTISSDFSQYDIETNENVEIISNDENGLSYKVLNSELNSIELTPKYNSMDYSYRYSCDGSQDLYCFEGEYNSLEPITLSLFGLNNTEYIDIYYSKKDSEGICIEGAEFSLYEINPDIANQELLFIHTNIDINLIDALIDNNNNDDNLSIKVSERYNTYLNNNIINTNEIGYFPYQIFNNDNLIKEGICYVLDDNRLTKEPYYRVNVYNYKKSYSEKTEINSISDVEKGKNYYICESEPAKGYVYASSPCYIVDTTNYNDEIYEFINSKRTYTLKLMKQSPYEVLLDGAKFKISYLENDTIKEIVLTTGYLTIPRENNNQYLIYKYENEENAHIYQYIDDSFSINNIDSGKYYYYQSNSNEIDYQKLKDNYVLVVKGGLSIENLPYSSSLTIEELEAPKGFMITDPIYYLSPNISYSEITFRNFRVNQFDILAKKKFKLPKTCIEN